MHAALGQRALVFVAPRALLPGHCVRRTGAARWCRSVWQVILSVISFVVASSVSQAIVSWW